MSAFTLSAHALTGAVALGRATWRRRVAAAPASTRSHLVDRSGGTRRAVAPVRCVATNAGTAARAEKIDIKVPVLERNPCTLNPIPYTLDPGPYTLYPESCTPCPIPYTLYP